MKNESSWKESKFVLVNGHLRANPDPKYVAIYSRLNVNLLSAALERVLSQYARGKLLDLGCGSVPLFAQYRQQVTEVMCVDWANSSHDISHLDIATDLNEKLPIETANFETVILTDVLEHIAQPEQLLSEIRRVLRTGGHLVGTVPFLYRLHEEPHDYYRYTIHALESLAVKHGFHIEVLEPYGAGTDVFFDVLGKLLHTTVHWRFGPRLTSWTQTLGILIRNSAIGRTINERSQFMPIGYVFVFRAT